MHVRKTLCVHRLVERTRPFNILFANIQIIIYLRHYKRSYFQQCSDAIENNVTEYEHSLFSSLFLPLSGLVVCHRINTSSRIAVFYYAGVCKRIFIFGVASIIVGAISIMTNSFYNETGTYRQHYQHNHHN